MSQPRIGNKDEGHRLKKREKIREKKSLGTDRRRHQFWALGSRPLPPGNFAARGKPPGGGAIQGPPLGGKSNSWCGIQAFVFPQSNWSSALKPSSIEHSEGVGSVFNNCVGSPEQFGSAKTVVQPPWFAETFIWLKIPTFETLGWFVPIGRVKVEGGYRVFCKARLIACRERLWSQGGYAPNHIRCTEPNKLIRPAGSRGAESVMDHSTEGRLDILEITVESIKEETAAIRRDLQRMMKRMGGGHSDHDEGSEGGSTSMNDNGGRTDNGGSNPNWRKRVDLPGFEGQEPHVWINRAERFFYIKKVAEEDKIELAYMSMEGSASYWFKIWRNKAKNRSWQSLKTTLINRFGGGLRGTIYEQLATLRQEGTVEEFTRSYEILLGQTSGLSEELSLGFFLAGLRDDIKGQVRIQDPKDLEGAIKIARDVDDVISRARGGGWNGVNLNAVGPRASTIVVRGEVDRQPLNRSGGMEGSGSNLREGLVTANSVRGGLVGGGDNWGRIVRKLPYPEFLKSREEGCCFRCGDPFAPGHRCSEKSLQVLLLAEDEADEEDGVTQGGNQQEERMELSACSAKGLTQPKTMKLTGKIGERRVVILIDCGASHNFVSRRVAAELELLLVIDTPPYTVSLGDGHQRVSRGRCEKVQIQMEEATVVEDLYVFELGGVDIILGMAWLAKLGDMVINWGKMSMAYVSEGKKLVEPKDMMKVVDADSWFLVWEVGQMEKQKRDACAGELTGEQQTELLAGLQTHYLGCRERESLPPPCDIKHTLVWDPGLVETEENGEWVDRTVFTTVGRYRTVLTIIGRNQSVFTKVGRSRTILGAIGKEEEEGKIVEEELPLPKPPDLKWWAVASGLSSDGNKMTKRSQETKLFGTNLEDKVVLWWGVMLGYRMIE
ncbi:hypothetical protein V8G54_030514 [Vigna mungo]|uniref:Ty3 transposon capsid-like protein domain-containing protein n=1 Tax=Vigna mungo TaxID=3915 RepID=A0AAQ3MWK4_VIGMU